VAVTFLPNNSYTGDDRKDYDKHDPKAKESHHDLAEVQMTSKRTLTVSIIILIETAAVVLYLNCRVRAQQPVVDPKTARARELDRFIDALANRNQPPRVAGSYALFSEKYDWAEQQRVQTALDVLVKHSGADLWPRLLAHLDDKRYALTNKINGVVANMTIGSICWNIAYCDLVTPFSDSWPNRSEISGNIFVGGVKLTAPPHHDLKTWYHARQGKALWELQVELGEWGIKTMEGLTELDKDEKVQCIQRSKATIDLLRRTKNPIVNKRWPYETDYFDAHEAKKMREEYLKTRRPGPSSFDNRGDGERTPRDSDGKSEK
jgi:hypothetical protein